MTIEQSRLKNPRVVLDTNVFISAAILPKSVPGKVVELGLVDAVYRLVTSEALLQELRRVTKQHRFHPDSIARQDLLRLIQEQAFFVEPTQQLLVIQDDKSDNRLLEAALASEAGYIVTGDKKHLLPLKEFRGIIILSPREFLNDLVEYWLG